MGQTVSLSNDRQTMSLQASLVRYCSAFGSVVAIKGGIYRWRLFIQRLQCPDFPALYIGVLGEEQCKEYGDKIWHHLSQGLAYSSDRTGVGRKYGEGDIVEVVLDLKHYRVKFR